MATKRANISEKSDKDPVDDEMPASSSTTPQVPRDVVVKILGFTFAMIIAPIGSFFLSVHTIFKGKPAYAGALAAIVANAVLFGFLIVAFGEDDVEPESEAAKKKTL